MNSIHRQQWYDSIRQKFLLTFFDADNRYEEKELNGFILIRQFNNYLMRWEVAIYTESAFQKRLNHKERVENLFLPRRNKQKRG